MTLDTTQNVPLELWKDGTIRVKGTRLLLDMIIHAHNRGEIPEDIADSFPAASVADVYAIIAYYLNNKKKINRYLAKQEREAEKVRKMLESLPGYKERQHELKNLIKKRGRELNK